jgi:hypothetical protein
MQENYLYFYNLYFILTKDSKEYVGPPVLLYSGRGRGHGR